MLPRLARRTPARPDFASMSDRAMTKRSSGRVRRASLATRGLRGGTGRRAQKNPAGAGFLRSAERGSGGGLQRLDAGVQAALVTGGLVLVDQATRAETVE